MLKFILACLLWAVPALSAEKIVLTTYNTVNFRGVVDGISITKAQYDLVKQVKLRGNKNYPIYLVFDSPGGSIVAGQAFIEFVKSIKNLHTISVFAASMASGIVEAIPGKRYVLGTGVMMFHRAYGSFEGQFETGELESQIKLWKEIVLSMEVINAERMGISIADYKAKVANEWWAYGINAVTEGMADSVANVTCTPNLIDLNDIVLSADLFGESKLTYSGCPLFRVPKY